MTGEELLALWGERDSRLSRRRQHGVSHSLTDVEAEAVVWWRRREAEALEGSERMRALTHLANWQRPTMHTR